MLDWQKAIQSLYSDLPEIETERLILRRMRESDADDAYRYTSDPEVTRFVPLAQSQSKADAQAFVRSLTSNYEAAQVAPWAVVLKDSGRNIGICGYENWGPKSDRAEFGFMFARDTWGQGYAREASAAVIRFGFERMSLNRIEARTRPDNASARHLLEKLGMTYEGTLRENMRWKGAYHDLMMYALLRRDWRS